MEYFRLVDGVVRYDNRTKKYYWKIEFFDETQQSGVQYQTKLKAQLSLQGALDDINLALGEIEEYKDKKYLEWTKKHKTFVL